MHFVWEPSELKKSPYKMYERNPHTKCMREISNVESAVLEGRSAPYILYGGPYVLYGELTRELTNGVGIVVLLSFWANQTPKLANL